MRLPSRSASMAEKFRHDLAVEWLGKPMPNWSQPCPITVQVGDHLGAGGATSFVFNHGEVFGWQMNIQGPLDRVLDSVLPHEVTHTIFASHFRQPLPRWADEGGCTTVEHDSERIKQQKMLIAFLRTGRGIAFSQMFAMKEYPRDILPLYAQGHSLASFLMGQGGKQKFLAYLAEGMENEDWVTRRSGTTGSITWPCCRPVGSIGSNAAVRCSRCRPVEVPSCWPKPDVVRVPSRIS